MSDTTKIEWTDATWNPITGCSVVSPGCTNCYAMRLAGTRMKHHPSRAGLTQESKAGPVWNGQVRLNEDWLDQPLRWKRPRRIFVCAHGDLFHENVPDEWIDRVFAVMALAPQHTFQVLTKRAVRMREYFKEGRAHKVSEHVALYRACGYGLKTVWKFPAPPNVWLGVSVEDQTRADERIPELLDTPAAVRFVSAEPVLGPVDLNRVALVPKRPGSPRPGIHADALAGRYVESGLTYLGDWDISGPPPPESERRRLDWIIAGGESGPGSRPMNPDWVRSLRDQCRAAGTAFFFKQWGDWGPDCIAPVKDAHAWPWPDDRVRGPVSFRVGKRRAGRTLDGRTWDQMPERRAP